MNDHERVRWLDGLRGIASVQVLLLHFLAAFLPGVGLLNPELVRYRWEKWVINGVLFFPFDGYSAVYLFFLLSGTALNWSFSTRSGAFISGLARRLVRLGMPMAVAVALGAVLLATMPVAHRLAAEQSGSVNWLGTSGTAQITLGMVLHQIALEGMLAGYSGISLLPVWLRETLSLTPAAVSFDGPLWTLHIEWVGSMLLLLAVWIRHVLGMKTHGLLCMAFCVAFVDSPLILFALGHLAAPFLRRDTTRSRGWILGIACVTAGILLCCHKDWEPIAALVQRSPAPPLGLPLDTFHATSMFGAILIFVGLSLLPRLQVLLATRPMLWLGRISFSLYLVHFPILLTITCVVFLAMLGVLPYGLAAIGASIVGVAASFLLAIGFESWIDQYTVRLSRRIGLHPQQLPSLPEKGREGPW